MSFVTLFSIFFFFFWWMCVTYIFPMLLVNIIGDRIPWDICFRFAFDKNNPGPKEGRLTFFQELVLDNGGWLGGGWNKKHRHDQMVKGGTLLFSFSWLIYFTPLRLYWVLREQLKGRGLCWNILFLHQWTEKKEVRSKPAVVSRAFFSLLEALGSSRQPPCLSLCVYLYIRRANCDFSLTISQQIICCEAELCQWMSGWRWIYLPNLTNKNSKFAPCVNSTTHDAWSTNSLPNLSLGNR